MTALATNPADAYKTWIMGVRRTLQRTGYPEAAKHVGDYDRDLRGVFLSGAGPAEGAGVVSRRWQGGYNENGEYMQPNPVSGSGLLVGLGVVVVGGVALYFLLRPSPAAAENANAARAVSPPSSTTTPTPTAEQCPLDLTKLENWAKQHPTLQVSLTGTAKPPAFPPIAAPGSTAVAVTTDGNFWTYLVPALGPATAQRRDDLRDSYCKSVGATAGPNPAAMFMV